MFSVIMKYLGAVSIGAKRWPKPWDFFSFLPSEISSFFFLFNILIDFQSFFFFKFLFKREREGKGE